MKRGVLVVLKVLAVLAVLAAPIAAQAPDRSKPPQSGAPPTLKLPALQKRMLSNGLPVWIVEHHGVPRAGQPRRAERHGVTIRPAGSASRASRRRS
jgi:hypothetical protein